MRLSRYEKANHEIGHLLAGSLCFYRFPELAERIEDVHFTLKIRGTHGEVETDVTPLSDYQRALVYVAMAPCGAFSAMSNAEFSAFCGGSLHLVDLPQISQADIDLFAAHRDLIELRDWRVVEQIYATVWLIFRTKFIEHRFGNLSDIQTLKLNAAQVFDSPMMLAAFIRSGNKAHNEMSIAIEDYEAGERPLKVVR